MVVRVKHASLFARSNGDEAEEVDDVDDRREVPSWSTTTANLTSTTFPKPPMNLFTLFCLLSVIQV